MNPIDFVIIGIVVILFILAIIYIITHRGCTDSQCQNCYLKNDCHKKKKKKE